MGWDESIYVDYIEGVFYVGLHGGEGECNHKTEGKAYTTFEEAMRAAVQMAVRYHPCNGIQVYRMESLFPRTERNKRT